MDDRTMWVLLAAGLILSGIALAAFSHVSFYLKKRAAKNQALELRKICRKRLSGVEPDLSRETMIFPSFEERRYGRFFWQRRIHIVLGVVCKSPKILPLKTTLIECTHKYLDQPGHKKLWVIVDFQLQHSKSERPNATL